MKYIGFSFFRIIIFYTYWGRGKVWSLRLPVTQEVAGSNPVVPAFGQIAQSVEHLSENKGSAVRFCLWPQIFSYLKKFRPKRFPKFI